MSVPFMYPAHHKEIDFLRFIHIGIKNILERNGLVVASLEQNGGFWVFIMHMFTHYSTYRFFRNVPGKSLKIIFGRLKLIFTPLLLLFNVLFNASALALDKLDIENTFTVNYTVLAKKES